MEHKTLRQIRGIAELHPAPSRSHPMSKRERVERWIALLEQEPRRLLSTLPGTEYQPFASREGTRRADSAIALAYNDPVLRAEGLASDTYGAARRFFGLTHGEMHWITCSCHLGTQVEARWTASRLRSVRHPGKPPEVSTGGVRRPIARR